MTVKDKPAEAASESDVPFSVRADRAGDHLNLTISGRLDTITAPELLSVFQEEYARGELKSIMIDSGALTNISSAGLRVFLIMRKTLEDGSQFQIKNIRSSVQEIIDTTGFSHLFNCEG